MHITPRLGIAGCHCPCSPFGPKMECLDKVSSLGRGTLRDLQKYVKQYELKKERELFKTDGMTLKTVRAKISNVPSNSIGRIATAHIRSI